MTSIEDVSGNLVQPWKKVVGMKGANLTAAEGQDLMTIATREDEERENSPSAFLAG
jgi:hypothetical protein